MKKARLIATGVAVTASVFVVMMMMKKPAPQVIVKQANNQPQAPIVPATEVLVAKGDIPIGKIIKPDDLQWQKWPLDGANTQFINRTNSPKALEETVGAISRTSFVAGEPIRSTKIVKSGSKSVMSAIVSPGMRAIALPVTQEVGVAGFILPNDRVDIIMVRKVELPMDPKLRSKDDLTHNAQTILTNIRALASDQIVEEKAGEKSILARNVTVEVTPEQAEVISLGRTMGQLVVTLRSIADSSPDKVVASEGTDGDEEKSNSPFGKKTKNEGKQFNVIRFGVSQPVATK